MPDAQTFWACKEHLTRLEFIRPLCDVFSSQLNDLGYRARTGPLGDASCVPGPIQRNSREEHAIPIEWSQDHKRRQKDTDAHWTKKNGTSHYGYTNHVTVDTQNTLIRGYDVSDARVHDSRVCEGLLDESTSTKDVWAESAYRSEDHEASLKSKGYRSKIHRTGSRNKPLTQRERQGKATQPAPKPDVGLNIYLVLSRH